MKKTDDELFKNRYRVKSVRLSSWDYSSNGYYFVTICTHNREHYFGEIDVETRLIASLRMTEIGKMVRHYWLKIPDHFPFATLDEFVIMPNHVHGIVIIENDMNTNTECKNGDTTPPTNTMGAGGITRQKNPMFYQSISKILRWYKGRCTFEINKTQPKNGFKWQSRFYDHIIRNDDDLCRIRQYINNNPVNWNTDELFTDKTG